MNAEEWELLSIGEAVRIHTDGEQDRLGIVADKIHGHRGIYTVLIEIGRNGKKPLLKYFSLSRIRRE